MTQYDNTNAAFCSRTTQGKRQAPDYKGNVNVNGVEFWLSAWIKEGAKAKVHVPFDPSRRKPRMTQARRNSPSASGRCRRDRRGPVHQRASQRHERRHAVRPGVSMTRALIVLSGDAERERAAHWAAKLPQGTRVEYKAPKRSLPQNDRMWAMLTDVATQLPWHGIKLSPDDWKLIFLDALKRELRMVPNIDGSGFVNLGRSSSDLSKAEMTDLIELIACLWGKSWRCVS
jgi:hypothetical protein